MFILIDTEHDGKKNTIKLNTQQIAYIDGKMLQMANGFTVFATQESIEKLEEVLFGDTAAPNTKTSEVTLDLLNELYKLTGSKGDVKATSDRKARLKTRMKDFTAEELKIAAKNLGEDAFMQGENDANKRYGTIDWLLRTSGNVNKFLEVDPAKPKKNKMF